MADSNSPSIPTYSPDDPVVAQYEQWQYPAPVADLTDPAAAAYLRSYSTLDNLAPIYWPAGSPRTDLDVLVAGCGTMAAASYALLNPRCRVVGIDVSHAALAHEQRLKDRHKLDNLTLRHCPIERVASLDMSFDFVGCQGVLHHMPDPVAGLRALGGVLRRDGVIAIMVYAKYGRTGVYMLQDLFRLLGVEQTSQGVAVVRETLANLPADHPVQAYRRHATDLGSDAGLVDTFLHPRDRSFSVGDCISLVSDAGMAFQNWDRNFFYYPEGPFQYAPALCDRLAQLPDEQIWQAMELAFGAVGVHYFHVCRRDRDIANYRVPWGSQRLLDCIPIVSARLIRGEGPDRRPVWSMAQAGLPPVFLPEAHAAIFSHVNGKRTIRDCMAAAGVRGEATLLLDVAREFLRRVWRCGFGVIRW